MKFMTQARLQAPSLLIRLVVAFMISSVANAAKIECTSPAISDDQIREIVSRSRVEHDEIPREFSSFRWSVRRQGCHYVYIETGLPESPDYRQVFTLNQSGKLVDVENVALKCDGRGLSMADLRLVIDRERSRRPDIPSAGLEVRIQNQRLRCMYMVFEYAVPEVKGKFDLFTVDQYGELLDFYRSSPY